MMTAVSGPRYTEQVAMISALLRARWSGPVRHGALASAAAFLRDRFPGASRPVRPTAEPEVVRSPQHMYQGRPVMVVADLASLRGPVTGTVTLPLEVYWSGTDASSVFDLDNPVRRKALYRTVVREARRPEHLTGFLDRDTLIRVWALIVLPPQVRGAWEAQHPALAAARLAHARSLRAAS